MSNEDICPTWLHACHHGYEYECDEAERRGNPCPPVEQACGNALPKGES